MREVVGRALLYIDINTDSKLQSHLHQIINNHSNEYKHDSVTTVSTALSTSYRPSKQY